MVPSSLQLPGLLRQCGQWILGSEAAPQETLQRTAVDLAASEVSSFIVSFLYLTPALQMEKLRPRKGWGLRILSFLHCQSKALWVTDLCFFCLCPGIHVGGSTCIYISWARRARQFLETRALLLHLPSLSPYCHLPGNLHAKPTQRLSLGLFLCNDTPSPHPTGGQQLVPTATDVTRRLPSPAVAVGSAFLPIHSAHLENPALD